MAEPRAPRSRLAEPSSAAGFAALLALLIPSIADQAPAIVELGMTVLAAIAGIAAIVQREASGSGARSPERA